MKFFLVIALLTFTVQLNAGNKINPYQGYEYKIYVNSQRNFMIKYPVT